MSADIDSSSQLLFSLFEQNYFGLSDFIDKFIELIIKLKKIITSSSLIWSYKQKSFPLNSGEI